MRARGEETDVTQIVEGFVAREVAASCCAAAAAATDGGVGGAVAGCGCARARDVRRCTWGPGRAWFSVVEGIGDDPGGVEIREHFRAERVDDFGDFGRELGTFLTESDEGVGGGGVEREDEWAEGFQDVHACFAEAEGGEGDGGEEDEAEGYDEPERHPSWHVALDACAVSPICEKDGVKDVEQRGKAHGNKEFPGCYDIPAFKLHGRSGKGFARLFDRDEFSGNKDGGEEDEAGQCSDCHDGEFTKAVDEGKDDLGDGEFGVFHLMVSDAEEPKLLVVIIDGFLEVENPGIVLVMCISFDKTSIELDNHWQRQFLARRIVQTPRGLNELHGIRLISRRRIQSAYHEGVIIWTGHCHSNQGLIDRLEQLPCRLSSFPTFIKVD